MFSALDLYLSTAPLPELLAYVVVALVAIFLGLFAPGHVAQHVSAYRSSVREA